MRRLMLTTIHLIGIDCLVSNPVALACATCGPNSNDPTRSAYLLTTGILSAVPLIAMGILILWLMRSLKKMDVDDSRDE